MGKTTKDKPSMEAVKEWAKRNNKLEPWCIGVYNYHIENHYRAIIGVQTELNRAKG